MNSVNKTSRVLGVAFLIQCLVPMVSGLILNRVLIVPGNIGETMIKIANHPMLMRANIFCEMITALGIIFLGAVLFLTLRKQNEILLITRK